MKICFVCTANICRSPFAEYFLRKRLKESGLDNFEVSSAGIMAQPGQKTTSTIIDIAREFDVDLTSHQTRGLSDKLLQSCQMIFGMEKVHCDEIELQYPSTKGRVYLLRNFALEGSKTRDITDPFGLSLDFVRAGYDDIAETIEGLIVRLKKDF